MNSTVRTDWPNGESYIKQESLLVDVFSVITNELKEMKENV